jgi:hypothetical protein
MNHEEWGEGPWNNEPDHAVWVDPATDLDVMINRGPSGALCGYVGVGPDHPLHGKSYMDVENTVDVHGGLTYANACQDDGDICHVPEPGREHDIWWFGFDCCHFGDVAPKMDADLREMRARIPEMPSPLGDYGPLGRSTYKDWEYVSGEIRNLAWQLKAVHRD